MSRTLLAGACALLLMACASVPTSAPPAQATPADAPTVIAETWISADVPAEELDSVATWVSDTGDTWLLATGKSTHRLSLFDGDTGESVRTIGSRGTAPGEFDRPNGLAVFGDMVFVVERDNRRVQLLSMPDFQPQASFGGDELRSPYGIWVHETAPGELEAFVTDGFMDGADHRTLPPASELGQRVRRYRIGLDQGAVHATHVGAFGATGGRGVLHMVESIAGDPAHRRLLIADEDPHQGSTLHAYDFDGRYTGRSVAAGTFAGDAEGVALWDCGLDAGYWLAVDQIAPHTRFHLFDRATLAPRGSFRGEVTANTDGIALHAAATPRFPAGALYAVHDDRALAAFDLAEVIRVLDLDPACAQ